MSSGDNLILCPYFRADSSSTGFTASSGGQSSVLLLAALAMSVVIVNRSPWKATQSSHATDNSRVLKSPSERKPAMRYAPTQKAVTGPAPIPTVNRIPRSDM